MVGIEPVHILQTCRIFLWVGVGAMAGRIVVVTARRHGWLEWRSTGARAVRTEEDMSFFFVLCDQCGQNGKWSEICGVCVESRSRSREGAWSG